MLKMPDEYDPKLFTVEQRREIVAQHIEREPERFDMGGWNSKDFAKYGVDPGPCGTVGCIAGWAAYLFNREAYNDRNFGITIPEAACEVLGPEVEELFYDWDLTAKEAAKKLRNL